MDKVDFQIFLLNVSPVIFLFYSIGKMPFHLFAVADFVMFLMQRLCTYETVNILSVHIQSEVVNTVKQIYVYFISCSYFQSRQTLPFTISRNPVLCIQYLNLFILCICHFIAFNLHLPFFFLHSTSQTW